MTGTIADLLNSPSEIVFEDRVYQLREPTLLEGGQYMRHLEAEARAAAARATELSEGDRRQLLTDVTADIAAKRFRWGGDVCVQSLRTVDGIAKLVSIICGISEELALRMCTARFREVLALVRGALEDDPEGKAAAALLKKVGLPPTFLSSGSSGSATPPSEPPPTSPPSAE